MVMLVLKKKYIFFIFKVKLFNMDLEDSKMNRGVYTPAWFTIIFFEKVNFTLVEFKLTTVFAGTFQPAGNRQYTFRLHKLNWWS